MFPLQQSDELVYQIFSDSNQHKIPQDMIMSNASLEKNIGTSMGKSRKPKVSPMETTSSGTEGISAFDEKHRKQKLHREIERQRRLDMSTHYASLRSLLPDDYIKGKRSMSDHMNEAAKYIKYLEKKVKDLDVKRNKLKKRAVTNLADFGGSAGPCTSNHYFTIRTSLIGIEIMFRCGIGLQEMPLSSVLAVLLLEEGLTVVSCTSTKSEDYILHTIQTEVNDPATSINISELQQKLSKISEGTN